ncbi:unnamed protein product [Prorocentrum cordatum]|uniref:Uncharacterized protein n=1 Tax=Prorocentrum cordatum TaxID=2364126 RepID=A0ABN9VB60_9DINO|nr:unnamed protein product [Polarella glacialis]
MWEVKVEPTIIYLLQRRDQRVRESLSVAACFGFAQRDTGGEDGAQRHPRLQRWNQRVRKKRAVAARRGVAQRDAESEAGAPLVSYNSGISACQKGGQWQRSFALLVEMWEATVETDAIGYSAGISACGKARQWQQVVLLLREMREAMLEPDVIPATPPEPARARGASAACTWSSCSAAWEPSGLLAAERQLLWCVAGQVWIHIPRDNTLIRRPPIDRCCHG